MCGGACMCVCVCVGVRECVCVCVWGAGCVGVCRWEGCALGKILDTQSRKHFLSSIFLLQVFRLVLEIPTAIATDPLLRAGTKWLACSRLLWDSWGRFPWRSGRERFSRILFLGVCVRVCVCGFALVPKFPRVFERFFGRLACSLWIT